MEKSIIQPIQSSVTVCGDILRQSRFTISLERSDIFKMC